MANRERHSYDSTIGEKANTKLAKRLQAIITDSHALANYLGCSIQAVNQYKQGTAFPKVENIIKIADYYNISVDYLFGLTDVRNRDTTVQSVCGYTGLSEDALNHLREAVFTLRALGGKTEIINWFFSSDYFLRLVVASEKYRKNTKKENGQTRYLTLDSEQQEIDYIMQQAAKVELMEVVSDMTKDIDKRGDSNGEY